MGGGDETFMRHGVGVGNQNENAKIELFSRTEGGVMRVKTARRRVGEEGGEAGEELGESESEDSPWM